MLASKSDAMEKANPEQIGQFLRGARLIYDKGRATGDTTMQRKGVGDALAAAIDVLARAFPDGAELTLPLVDLKVALEGIDTKTPSNLLRRDLLKVRDNATRARIAQGCAVVQILTEGERAIGLDEAHRKVARAIGEEAGDFCSWRKHMFAGRYPEARDLFDKVLAQARAEADPTEAADKILSNISI